MLPSYILAQTGALISDGAPYIVFKPELEIVSRSGYAAINQSLSKIQLSIGRLLNQSGIMISDCIVYIDQQQFTMHKQSPSRSMSTFILHNFAFVISANLFREFFRVHNSSADYVGLSSGGGRRKWCSSFSRDFFPTRRLCFLLRFIHLAAN